MAQKNFGTHRMVQIVSVLYFFNFSSTVKKYNVILMRVALSIVNVWCGKLQIFAISTASQLVINTVF
jgi:hypothetical protein